MNWEDKDVERKKLALDNAKFELIPSDYMCISHFPMLNCDACKGKMDKIRSMSINTGPLYDNNLYRPIYRCNRVGCGGSWQRSLIYTSDIVGTYVTERRETCMNRKVST